MTHQSSPHTFDSALEALKLGNRRFVEEAALRPHTDRATRDRLFREGQTPLAAVLACSDSRAPVELIFDLGFGDIFVVRAAGQVPGREPLGSLEYAVAHLGVPLVLVLGHTNCGAVTAAVKKAREPGALGQLLAQLEPVARQVESLPEEERVEAAVYRAVDHFVAELRAVSPTLAEFEKSGRGRILGAVYHLDSGLVEFRPEAK